MSIIFNTPIEKYNVSDRIIHVKREDLCCSKPGPPFSKVRGLYAHMTKLKELGLTIIGYTETSISMAGWGVSWVAKELGMKSVIFDPQYKSTPTLLKLHRKQWEKFDAEIIPIKAGMARVNYNICKKILSERYPNNSIMLDLGLPLEETIEETEKEVKRIDRLEEYKTIVVCVGSGTICSGLIRGFPNHIIIGVMSRTGDVKLKKRKILKKSKEIMAQNRLKIVDLNYKYTQKENIKCPFPSHKYYDRKAWKWLIDNLNNIEYPVLFWNIGH